MKRITIQRHITRRRPRVLTSGGSHALVASYAVVTATHSADGTADVETDAGAILQHVPVQSDSWVTVETPTGSRNLPPIGAQVLVLFPDGATRPERAVIVRGPVPAVSTDHDGVVFEDNAETTDKAVNEAGWTATYDRETGDALWESDPTDTNQIVIDVDRTNETVRVAVGSMDVEITPSQVNLAGDSKQLVTHAELDTALQAFQASVDAAIASAITGHTHAGVTAGTATSGPGAGAATPSSVDISAAAAANLRTG